MANIVRFQLRCDTAENWEKVNPILLFGELGLDITSNRIKMGDGLTAWEELPYVKPEVIDSLTGTSRTDALSSEQGRVLKGLIDGKTAIEVVDSLTSTDTGKALSAAQGKVLNEKIPLVMNSLTSSSTTAALSANQGRALNASIGTKLNSSAVSNESWTFTLSSGSTVTKKVVLWSS